jgi:hypothetical protein
MSADVTNCLIKMLEQLDWNVTSVVCGEVNVPVPLSLVSAMSLPILQWF